MRDSPIMTEPSSTPNRPTGCPVSSIDLWADEVLADPVDAHRRLRVLGPVVWLERPGLVAFPRFAEVRAALADWKTYSSAAGVAIEDEVNDSMSVSILTSDPPLHDRFRKPLMDQLSMSALTDFVPEIEATAARFAQRVCDAGTFDAVADLARPYSLTVVSDLVGLPEQGRSAYPPLAERAFNLFGPANDRLRDGVAALQELEARTAAACSHLTPGRKGQELCDAGLAPSVAAYTWPGIDTTVNALGSAVRLFAAHPDQWDLVRSDPSLIPAAFSEVLRLDAPVQYFTRVTTRHVEVGDVALGAGSRVLIMYGSANRDERRYPEPDRFDVTRNPTDQLAFGRGIHLCVGINLARLEAHSLLSALADRVARFEPLDDTEPMLNNTLHGLDRLAVRAVPA